jgi:hypothetical protein
MTTIQAPASAAARAPPPAAAIKDLPAVPPAPTSVDTETDDRKQQGRKRGRPRKYEGLSEDERRQRRMAGGAGTGCQCLHKDCLSPVP